MPTSQEILDLALPLIKKWEGLRLKPYLCSAKKPTIGYGSTFYLDGTPVTLQDKAITEEEAEELLRNTVNKTYLPAVLELCSNLVSPQQYAALLSWTYNLGVGALKKSTLLKKIISKNLDQVPAEIMKWTIADGKVSKGLISRRQSEVDMYLS